MSMSDSNETENPSPVENDDDLNQEQVARRRDAMKKMAKIAVATPAIMGILYSRRAFAAS